MQTLCNPTEAAPEEVSASAAASLWEPSRSRSKLRAGHWVFVVSDGDNHGSADAADSGDDDHEASP